MALSNPLHTKEITTSQISTVSFGFFTEDEIHKISVKNIISPIIFDNLKNPIRGGLYDPAMGPMDAREKCVTCQLNQFECPGHFGHVDLSVPLYNPLVFVTLYKLLRSTCLHCFKFRMAGAEVERYRRRLELLSQGKLMEAEALILGSSAKAKESGTDIVDAMDVSQDSGQENPPSDMDYDVTRSVRSSSARAKKGLGPRDPRSLTAQTLDAMIDTVTDFFRKQPSSRCQNCGAHNPTVKREGFTKLFLMPLPGKKRAANAMQGTPILGAMPGVINEDNGVGNGDVAAVELAMGAKMKSREEKRKAKLNQKSAGLVEADDAKKNDAKMGDVIKTDEDMKDDSDDHQEEEEEEDDGDGGGIGEEGRRPPTSASVSNVDETHGSSSNPKFLTPVEVKEIMKRMWDLNDPLLAYIYPTDVARRQRRRTAAAALPTPKGYQDFFIQTVPVAPNRFRPVNHVGDMVYEHPQNVLLLRLINGNLDLVAESKGSGPAGPDAGELDDRARLGRTLRIWLDLQNSINALFDSSTADETHGVSGIRQQLEKKEGLFRKNMMGKRVNFAARSVISPDVYLNGGEIGVPPYFASRLSFPERVTQWNVQRLAEAVINGPGRNPGAVAVEDEYGRIIVLKKDRKSRESVAAMLLQSASRMVSSDPSPDPKGVASPGSKKSLTSRPMAYGSGKVVYRTMNDGDFMLTNRQPTLHKPGMMGHRARIMRAERTIRFHYANCSTFNADFDGDEINLHLPQDHLGRAEGYFIVHADQQFFVPTDGKPLRGLIQDHIVAGTLLTMKDCFLTQGEYCQMVYECIAPDCSGAWNIWMEPPAVLKPRPLWTGKQVFTAILMHYTRDQLPFTMAGDSKIPLDVWGKTSGEGKMHIWKNYLVAGCVDKATFGKHGLLHIFHELYGAERTSIFTAALSRLFTAYLQHRGFTCGMSDVFLLPHAEEQRQDLLSTADIRAIDAAAQFAGVQSPQNLVEAGANTEDALSVCERLVRAALSQRYRASGGEVGAALDMKISGAMHPLSSEVVKACLPAGQQRPFRHNMMALMTVTGAKGSVVNFSQISCLLGQQELEGRRVPRMASGKTLPCFVPYDSGARSGGFVGDRFLTGLRPQEYYFHCMAGREGLVDTTVKTSRSGYLQRCLVKNLEPLRVAYDATVRDDCDGSVVQFAYGEDGLDPTQTGCIRTMPLLFYNMAQSAKEVEAAAMLSKKAKRKGDDDDGAREEEKIKKLMKKRAKALLHGQNREAAKELPISSRYLQTTLGVTSEGFQDALTYALFGGVMLPPNPDGIDAAYKAAKKEEKKVQELGEAPSVQPLDVMDFQNLMHVKYYRSQVQPGEAVGVIAAQSVGEPSTQMTLNTFHMAGRGEANVTLGIPRLREILMTAAAAIKTPVMTIPILPQHGEEGAKKLAVRLKRIRLAETLKGLRVKENVVARTSAADFGRGRTYQIELVCHPSNAYPAELGITFEEISLSFKLSFLARLESAVKLELKRASASSATISSAQVQAGEDGAAAVLTSEDSAPKRKQRSAKDDEDENQEENEEYVEGKLKFSGGRGEQATYGDGDEEDKKIEKAVRKQVKSKHTNEDDDDDDEEDHDDGEEEEGDGDGKHKAYTAASKKQKSTAAAAVASHADVDDASCVCRAVITVPLDAPKILMRELAEKVAAETIVRGVKDVAKCYILDSSSQGGTSVVQTDGINMPGVWESGDLVDVDLITTNSPAAMLQAMGVEAARATVVKEVSSVFGAYGIAVDPRHLSLIADHMTHMGGYRACNRIGIEASTSPFLKISFETAASFLVSATLHGDVDPLSSPAARIVVGRPVKMGTGSMDLIQEA